MLQEMTVSTPAVPSPSLVPESTPAEVDEELDMAVAPGLSYEDLRMVARRLLSSDEDTEEEEIWPAADTTE